MPAPTCYIAACTVAHQLDAGLICMVHAFMSTHVYARYSHMSPAGFTPNFASLTGAWGVGIYYSSKPQLAMQFGHSLKHSDLAFNAHLAGLGRSERQGLKQVLAVDVLTGKSKHLSQNRALRMPPKIEDTRLAEYVLLNQHAKLLLPPRTP